MTANKTRIAMEHGFMKSIIKNQVDRDNYDKEMKEKPVHANLSAKLTNRSKKPDQNTYVVPSARAKSDASSEDITFIFEYEDENGKVLQLPVHKNDDIVKLARQFGSGRHMNRSMINALTEFLQNEVDKRST